MRKSAYREIVDRLLAPSLIQTGFVEVRLVGCISYEALYRKNDLWFGTSWDYRDQYLDLDFGNIYWLIDVMPRVIVLGKYSHYAPKIERLDQSSSNYLDLVALTVAQTLQDALAAFNEHPADTQRQQARLRPALLGPALDSQLIAFGA